MKWIDELFVIETEQVQHGAVEILKRDRIHHGNDTELPDKRKEENRNPKGLYQHEVFFRRKEAP